MADDIDISNMPDPSTIGLSPAAQSDPTAGMPDPVDLYKQTYGQDPYHGVPKEVGDEAVANFMAHPPAKSVSEAASAATGIPRAAAGLALAVPAGVASVAGQLTGIPGAVAATATGNTDLIPKAFDQARDRGRDWAEKVNKLADYVPVAGKGGEAADFLQSIPGEAVKRTVGAAAKAVLPDNAYQAAADVARDVGTDLPALGAPAALKATSKVTKPVARAAAKAADAVKDAVSTDFTPTPQPEPLKPDVGEPVTPEALRAAPNPIPPPDGTVARAKSDARAASAPTPPPSGPLLPDGATAGTLAREAEARRRMAEDGLEPELYSEPFAGRQAEHEGAVAARMREDDDTTPDMASAFGGSQRGSVKLFNEPAKEGPQETPTPDKQAERQAQLDALDKLSGGGLPVRRQSALTGDYNATGDDFQMKEVGNEQMRQQIASENSALHTAAENVHSSIGSQFANSVDSTTLGDRGRVTRGAIQAIEKHFDDATDGLYNAARAQNSGRPIPKLQRLSDYLNDDSNFTNDAEIGLQKAAKARMDRLWSTGDPDKGDGKGAAAPGSVNAAERLREFLNEKGKNPQAMGVASAMKGHLDMDVADHGGPGMYDVARAMRRHKYQMLEEPQGIKKLLAPADSQGINHAIPEHKVMDYIADLPRDQHEHVLNVLRAGAHLDPEVAKRSAEAIREIQAHTVSRIHAAATNADGTWNSRKFYNAADRYARNMPDTFKDRPDVIKNLRTIGDAGNTLRMDKHYPGAAAQTERTGAINHALETGGHIAASVAHEIPVLGRFVGRRIESAVDRASGKISESTRDREVAKRLVDRNGKQRGSVRVMDESPAERMKDEFDRTHPEEAPVGQLGKRVGKSTAELYTDPGDPNTVRLEKLAADQPGGGHGTAALKRITDLADKHGTRVTLDAVPQGKNPVSRERLMNYYKQHGFEPDGNTAGSMTREPQTGGATLNIGLHQGQEGQPGFRRMSRQEASGAVESTGAKVTRQTVLTPDQHGVAEPTLVADTDRPLTPPEMQKVLAKTKQSAIPQRTARGEESMHVAPGHEEIAKQEGWDKFNPDYFRTHEGTPLSKQRGSVRVMNDKAQPREERNPRSEFNANRQIAGGSRLTPEQEEIIRKLGGGQRGSVRVMNEKPLKDAPEGDRPNAVARTAAAAYAKKAGMDYKPLNEYRYIDPEVAKSVGNAYEEMKHDPTNPKVKASYDAFKKETLAQYKQMEKAGVKVDLDPSYPYKNPREMHEDVRQNNHMSIYPTEAGFGSEGAAPSDHPMLERAPIKMGGKDATYNDLFRAVHDYFGHAAEGNGFRANGEYNAWRAHRQMYSDAARGAMDAETLGQNSWVNAGPPAEFNKGASQADTIYADQKAGLLPPKVVKAAEEGVGADEHHITNQLTNAERQQLRSDTSKRLIDAFNSAPATKEYAAAALAGAAKRGWYRNSAQAMVNQFGPDAPRFAGLLSAMSPQVSVQTNFANALKTFINWDKAGRPEDPSEIRRIMEESSQKSAKAAPGSSNVLDAWVNNAVRALTADDPTNIKLSGPKVHSFYKNLTDNVHEVTNDAWMAAFSKTDPAKLGGGLTKTGPGKSPTYLALSAKVRDAARMLSHLTGETWTPAEVQETVWSWAKTAYEHAEEKGDRSIPELVKNGDITDELIRSTPDFHQLFGTSEHRGLLQSSSFAGNVDRMAGVEKQSAESAGTSKARQAAQEALRPALISAAERLEQLRQERKAAGKAAPKEE